MFDTSNSGVVLLYHDVVPPDTADSSGIVTEGSWRYKVAPDRFRSHLAAIDSSPFEVRLVDEADSVDGTLVLTFDDGGISFAQACVPILDTFGFRGHFFVITGRLGDEGYLSREQVRGVANAGHHVGSHTVTHRNLRTLDPDDQRRELVESRKTLETVLDRPCKSVSIPGGFSDGSVVEAAFDAGYEYVFTSNPRYFAAPLATRCRLGRWTVWHDTDADELLSLLRGDLGRRLKVQGRWYLLRTVKRAIGQDRFDRLREPLITHD